MPLNQAILDRTESFHGLYDPAFEHDACGVGMVASIKGMRSNSILQQGADLRLLADSSRRDGCRREDRRRRGRADPDSLQAFPARGGEDGLQAFPGFRSRRGHDVPAERSLHAGALPAHHRGRAGRAQAFHFRLARGAGEPGGARARRRCAPVPTSSKS